MKHFAQSQHSASTIYSMDHNLERWASLEQDVVGHGQIVYRAEVPLGAAQGRYGEVMTIVQRVARGAQRHTLVDIQKVRRQSVILRKPNDQPPAWLENLATLEVSRSPEALKQTMDSLLESLMKQGPDFVNTKLALVDVERAHASHLMAVLRGLFAWKSQLTNWGSLREKAAEELRNRGFKLEVIMKGLLS